MCTIYRAAAFCVLVAVGAMACAGETTRDHLATARDRKADKADRVAAVKAIGGLPDKDKAIADLLPLLRDGDLAPHVAAVLSETGAVDSLAAQMKDPLATEVEAAFSGMVLHNVRGALETCVRLLSSEAYLARKRALDVLASIRQRHAMQHARIVTALPALVARAAEDKNLLIRLGALEAVGSFGPISAPAAAEVARLLQGDADAEIRAAAVVALGKIGSAECLPPLANALGDGNEELGYTAALALGAIGQPAVEPLVKVLGDGRPRARRFAAFALAKIGDKASGATAALAKALADGDPLVRRNAADALGRLGDQAVVPALAALANDPSQEVRLAAAGALKILAPDEPRSRSALQAIREKNRQPSGYPGAARGPAAEDGSGVFFPEAKVALYNTHHGEPPGYPGCLPNETDAEGKPKYPKWGNPQVQPYPGSVEHYRTEEIKYTPPWTLFTTASLVKNFRATELAEAKGAVEDYAEPVYYTPMYSQSKDTGRRNAAVQVVRARVGGPGFRLDLGTLGAGLYVLRAIGAVEGNPTGYRKPLYFDLEVNDQPGRPDAMTGYRLRVGYVDEFYSLAEFYFYAPEKRAYRAVLRVGERSEVQPLVYNIDLHDVLQGCAVRPIKGRTTLHRAAEVVAARATYQQQLAEKKAPGFRFMGQAWHAQPGPLPPEERLHRDRALWNAFPPLNRNFGPGYSDLPTGADDGWKDVGGLGELSLQHEGLGLRYTHDDFLAHRPLPGPYPHADDGGGVILSIEKERKYGTVFLPIARAVARRISDYQHTVNGMANNFPGIAEAYLLTGDESAARDAAFMLCRLAYAMPTIDSGRQQLTAAIAGNTTDLQWGGKDHWTRRRLNRVNAGAAASIAGSYDILFDYIRDNQELAAAVGRFIPWIKTPEDVIAFLDCATQFSVKRLVHFHLHTGGQYSQGVIRAATELGDWPFTRPWMDWVFRETWKYPNARAGLADYATTSTTRDGTSYIGSWFYANDRPAFDFARLTEAYIQAGGLKEFDLSDPKVYPKALAGCRFDLDGWAAGLHYLGIGDVGGPGTPHGHWFNQCENRMRMAWQWTKDPKFAYALAEHFGRKAETDAQWNAIIEAAKTATNPWFSNRSRVLSSWGGILESGVEHYDFRFRRAALVRVGYGWGHEHDDTLDLILWCHGLIHAADGGERPEKRSQDEVKGPADQKSYLHNVVEVDGEGSHRTGNWSGHSWVRTLKDTPGARWLDATAAPGKSHPYVNVFRRQVALVDIDEGRPSSRVPRNMKEILDKLDQDVTPPDSYVFDVFRVAGGRRHTWCFHGPTADEFRAGTIGVREVPYGDRETPEGRYLKNFICPDNRTVGKAPAMLEATWRLRRAEEEIRAMRPVQGGSGAAGVEPRVVFKTWNAEARTLGKNYDPQSPRKYTRACLFGQEGSRVLTGRWIASAPAITFDCLYVQRELPGELPEGQPGNLQSVFPAVIEMYAGEPVIQGQRLAPIESNETDALAAAAVEISLRGGRTDVCFADGRPERVRRLKRGLEVSGETAFVSWDGQGLRQATLVGGTRLVTPQANIEVALRQRVATIRRMDYAEKKAWIDQPWPRRLLDGQAAEIGTPRRLTTYMIASVEPDAAGATVTLDKGMDYYASLIKEVDPQQKEVLCGLGFPTGDGAVFPGLCEDLVISNARATKFWRGEYLGGTREDGFRFKLDGPVTQADFGLPAGKLRVWEIGAGDTIRVPSHASLRRLPDGRYELRADTPVRLRMSGVTGLRISSTNATALTRAADKDGWIALDERDLGDGVVFVEAVSARLP